MESCDFFVIGGGSGGVRSARLAARLGARVVLAESPLGGTCVNVGCIPKKLYSYAAHYAHAFQQARGFGWKVEHAALDWDTLKAARHVEISRLNGVYENLLAAVGVEVIKGHARLSGQQTVIVGERE